MTRQSPKRQRCAIYTRKSTEHNLDLEFNSLDAEREVIGERVRDEIAASKRKGLWVGGPVPLGYATEGKKLVVAPVEAKIVRTIFSLYLEVDSVAALAEILERKGIRTKVRPLLNG